MDERIFGGYVCSLRSDKDGIVTIKKSRKLGPENPGLAFPSSYKFDIGKIPESQFLLGVNPFFYYKMSRY